MVPDAAIMGAATPASNSVLLTCTVPVINIGFGFVSRRVQTMTVPGGKFVPNTLSTKSVPPAATVWGDRLVKVVCPPATPETAASRTVRWRVPPQYFKPIPYHLITSLAFSPDSVLQQLYAGPTGIKATFLLSITAFEPIILQKTALAGPFPTVPVMPLTEFILIEIPGGAGKNSGI
jgi:hypothetical protein